MKKILLTILFTAPIAGAAAQGIQKMRANLERPEGANRARVEVVEEPDAARAVAAADRIARLDRISGYRVSLFRDNSQTAGENARAVAAQFRERFPGVPVQVAYESPYFKVTAGNFIDKVDAIALWGKSLPHFPKAVVIQEEVSVQDVISQQKDASGRNADGEINE